MKNRYIDNIIELLEYNKSKELYYLSDLKEKGIKISSIQMKSLMDIKPYAIYCKENKPFVIFIPDDSLDKEANKKIWNMQIPIVISVSENTIKIFEGSNLDTLTKEIQLIEEKDIEKFKDEKKLSFWDVHNIKELQKYCNRTNNLNNLLLKNIKYLNNELKTKYNIKFATKLVLRIIFIRFLIDKGVNIDYDKFNDNIEDNKNKFIEIIRNKDELYKLFRHLKQKFNGNLFDIEGELEDTSLNNNIFELISDFISAKQDLVNNQISFFDIYDFDIIPISLISAIYEIILGEDTQNKDKAFYTPDYLVKYLLQDIEICNKNSFKVLDPSCGSGIFLVETFQKILEMHTDENGYINDDKKINKLLTDNIYGIDINEEAIDISIFSLYLVIMEYKNPKTLQNYKFPTLKGINLLVADFFDDKKVNPILEKQFDLIIGNPPWGKVDDNTSHRNFCIDRNFPVQNNEISRSFLFKAIENCKQNTLCCLVLPSSLLYNVEEPARETRKIILEQTKIVKIIEMSSVRKMIFENAIAPTFCIFIKKDNTDYLKNKIKYTSLKPNIYFRLFNTICIEKNDTKYIVQEFFRDNDWAWKTVLYGSYFDVNIIMKLKNKYKTLGEVIEEEHFVSGTGLATNLGDAKDARKLIGKKILDAKNDIDSFYVNDKPANIFNKKYIHRIPNLERFKAPFIAIKKGVNLKNYKLRAGYSENDFLFTNAITSIKGNIEQKDKLLNMVGLLNSSLYAYLTLMLASSVGIEREQHYKKEVMDKPYIYSKDIVNLVRKIITMKKDDILNEYEIENNIKKLDNIVLKEFGLQNNEAVDYILNVELPSIVCKKDYVSTRASEQDLRKYSQYFIDYFIDLFENEKNIKVTLYPNIKGILTIFELEIVSDTEGSGIEICKNIDKEKEFLGNLIIDKIENIMYARDILHFEKNTFYIIKSNELKNWHPLKAKIDLEEVLGNISLAGEEECTDE